MPRAALAGTELAELLGGERSALLEDLLRDRLAAWAAEFAAGAVFAAEPGERPAAAFARMNASGGGGGPLLIAWPDLARWRADHAAAALDDLRSGCGLSLGPVFDGGFYLVALARPEVLLPQLPDDVWHSHDAMAIAFTAAHAAGIEAGMLRAERGLHSREDVRAALADPLLDGELKRILDRHR